MQWVRVSFRALRHQFESLEETLLENGAISVSLENHKAEEILEPGVGETPLWSSIKLTALFLENSGIEKLQGRIAERMGVEIICCDILKDRNWQNEHQKNFSPVWFNNKLCICPTWIDMPKKNSATLIINPGLAFGTGEHPTTALCLDVLSRKKLKQKTVVDFGCGSGILGLAALKLEASTLLGIDIDPQALRASRENAILNDLTTKLKLSLSTDPQISEWQGKADLVLANILANPLMELAPRLTGLLKDGGSLILSGILESQVSKIRSVYSRFLALENKKTKEGWTVLEGTYNLNK